MLEDSISCFSNLFDSFGLYLIVNSVLGKLRLFEGLFKASVIVFELLEVLLIDEVLDMPDKGSLLLIILLLLLLVFTVSFLEIILLEF
jgi:hypothetical protein